jgi:ABC-type multidrug transport system fused ATPase/permease subunit
VLRDDDTIHHQHLLAEPFAQYVSHISTNVTTCLIIINHNHLIINHNQLIIIVIVIVIIIIIVIIIVIIIIIIIIAIITIIVIVPTSRIEQKLWKAIHQHTIHECNTGHSSVMNDLWRGMRYSLPYSIP